MSDERLAAEVQQAFLEAREADADHRAAVLRRDRLVYELHNRQGWSYARIGKLLGVPRARVQTMANHGKP